VIGVWAFFFLGILAILFGLGKQGNIGHFDSKDNKKHATTLWITWGIYVALVILCSINLWYRSNHPWPKDAPEENEHKGDSLVHAANQPESQ
jgi:hypothetical protein